MVEALATRAVDEIPSSNNLRLQNLVESQLDIRNTESCLIALSAKFALKSPPPCLSPRTPYILAPRNGGEREMVSLRYSGDSIEGWTRMHELMSYRRFGRARSLRSDRASAWSLRSDRALARARSLRSNRALTYFCRRYVARKGLTGRYVASGSKPRRVLRIFVVKSQRKLRLRRNEKRFDEDSKENPKEVFSEA
ncbi:hypothetical protein F2Q69_00054445 [Brassica cretica]|uniref:Uncharacterized protein n=1 Tax=Brassica cretica TaxID=69181 RepID=A0A8S9N510_BRACR|nr:hypothetical protein F2Q69_00054445 [Brassica cretica]